MSWFFKSKNTTKPVRPAALPVSATAFAPGEVELQNLGTLLLDTLRHIDKGGVDLDLLRARIADFCRETGVQPVPPEEALKQLRTLDQEALRRLTAGVRGFEDRSARLAFANKVKGYTGEQINSAMISFAQRHHLLTIELLVESPLRREEFLRHFISMIEGTVFGETLDQSNERLKRLDYAKLMAEAEKARVSAGDRAEYIRKLQEEQERRIGRRGKF
jgi:hypothetical protein